MEGPLSIAGGRVWLKGRPAACAGDTTDGMKESAVKQAFRRAQFMFYALAPVLLVLGYHTMGKRWG